MRVVVRSHFYIQNVNMENRNRKYIGGFCFKYKSGRTIRYFECSERETINRCPAKGKELQSGEFIITGDHSHVVPPKDPEKIAALNTALKDAVRSSMRRLRPIYDEVALNHPYAASYYPFIHMERKMYRWKAKVCPSTPRSLQEYANTLNSERWNSLLEFNGNRLTVIAVEFQGGTATIMGDVPLIERIFQIDRSELFIDATFEVCPRVPEKLQLLTIMARIDDTCQPIAWAFMQRRTTIAYTSVLRQFSVWAPPLLNRPLQIHVDNEAALRAAIRMIYPQAITILCYFHYLQLLTRRLKKMGKNRMEYIYRWDQGKNFFRKLEALPLFPATDIPTVFNWLRVNATKDQKNFFNDLLNYIENHWIKEVLPENFSVYNYLRRTNNPIEAYHKQLQDRIGHHPTMWEFTTGLVRLASVVRTELRSLDLSISVRRPREVRYELQDLIINQSWQLYQNGSFDIPKFLTCANHFLRTFNNKLLITDLTEVNYFINVAEHNINFRPQLDKVNIVEMDVAVGRHPVLVRPVDGQLVKILSFRNLEASKCRICRQEIAEYVTIPCHHWYGCHKCTNNFRMRADEMQVGLSCRICLKVIVAFQKAYVS